MHRSKISFKHEPRPKHNKDKGQAPINDYRLRLEITADNLNINWLALPPGNCASLIP